MQEHNFDWRQGSVLSDEYAASLGLIVDKDPKQRIVVISHDCDIPSHQEPIIEVIQGSVLTKEDSLFIGARHPRKLHLKIDSDDGSTLFIELSHLNSIKLKKADLSRSEKEIDLSLSLSTDEKRILKQWLASRYGRPAYPNAFEHRLRKKPGKNTVEYLIGQISSAGSKKIVGIFFDLGEDRDKELKADEPYFLTILIVYDAIEGGPEAREAAEKTAQQINELFDKAYTDDQDKIILDKCTALADTHFSLADLRKVDQWRLEYVSLIAQDSQVYVDLDKSLI